MKRKQCIVVGLGRFGTAVAKELYLTGNDVLAIDINQAAVSKISESVTMAVQLDASRENELKTLGINTFDAAVVAIGSDIQSSVLITLAVKELGVKYIVAKADNDMQARILYSIGVDKVIFPEKDMGVRVAHNALSPHILDYIELSANYSITNILCPREYDGKTLNELRLPNKYEVTVIAIKREESLNILPKASDTVYDGDILIVIGDTKSLNTFESAIDR